MTKALRTLRNNWPIYLIILFAFLLRAWQLTRQSLWLDELHTMLEADPSVSWGQMFYYLKYIDPHPPLYFIIERLAFTVFGHTEGIARSVSLIAGTISIWAMWLLGKEMYNRSLGYSAAILACINYYNIFYSQEARGYIFAFLFTALSFLYFIRLIKLSNSRNIVLYAVFTLCLLYSHYYSLFVVMAQGILALLFMFVEEYGGARKTLFKGFLGSGMIIAIGHAPWIPFLLEISNIKSFWIGEVPHDFLFTFFKNYFGDAATLLPIFTVLLIVYVVHVSLKEKEVSAHTVKNNPLHFNFIIISGWVFITYLIPYLRSIMVVPMLYPRYTIVVLPAILLALAWGVEAFKLPVIKYGIISLIMVLSLTDIVVSKKYYSDVHKTQFREITAFVVRENKNNYPIINQVTAWHQAYYLKKLGSKAKLISGNKEAIIDSIVKINGSKGKLDGFWIVGAHGEQPINEKTLKLLETHYTLLKQEKLYDAWAQLFVSRRNLSASDMMINYTDFAAGEGSVLNDEKAIAIWAGAIHTKTIYLAKGAYNLILTAKGTSFKNEFPHLNLYVDDKKIGNFYTTDQFSDMEFPIENTHDSVIVKIEMDNDLMQEGIGDRNAFIKSIILMKKSKE